MKKITIILAIVIAILVLNKEEKVVIPKEAIRFRVIANSNQEKDQLLKKKVVNKLKENLITLEFPSQDIETSRLTLKNNLPRFDKMVQDTLGEENSNEEYTINYGSNYFPKKEYKGVVYEEGEYESLVVTLGNGLGDNFWCVLFPPLCLMDEEEENISDVEYTSFIKEILDKYF